MNARMLATPSVDARIFSAVVTARDATRITTTPTEPYHQVSMLAQDERYASAIAASDAHARMIRMPALQLYARANPSATSPATATSSQAATTAHSTPTSGTASRSVAQPAATTTSNR